MNSNNLNPGSIKYRLDQFVVGQDDVKKSLAALSFYYLQALQTVRDNPTEKMEKSNMLIIGDTGCGKTLLVKSLSEILEVPFTSVDATTLTSAGYKGNNIDSIFTPFVQAAKDHGPKVPAIVFIDEIDKMIAKEPDGGRSLQNEFLKIIEGSEVFIETSPYKGTGRIKIDTSQMMFVFSGSFAPIIKKLKTQNESAVPTNKRKIIKVKHDDLEKFGVSREFMGRISVIRTMEQLSKEMLVKIFTEPKDSLYRQYQNKLGRMGIQLEFTPEAIEGIAAQALETGMGARALATVTSEHLDNILFEAPTMHNVDKLTITQDTLATGKPKIIYEKPSAGRQSRIVRDRGENYVVETPGDPSLRNFSKPQQVILKKVETPMPSYHAQRDIDDDDEATIYQERGQNYRQ